MEDDAQLRPATAIQVFPDFDHTPLWTDGQPYREALRLAGVDDGLFEEFVSWGRRWEELVGTELGHLDDWSTVAEVQPFLAEGWELVGRLRSSVAPEVVVSYRDDAGWHDIGPEGGPSQ